MFSRQRAILRLIKNEGGTVERLRLVKLAFLMSREGTAPPPALYSFVPFKRGPFSFTLYHELATLGRIGWIEESGHNVILKEASDLETAFLDRDFLTLIDDLTERYRSTSTSLLVQSVYREYPWFTLNSEAIDKRTAIRPTAQNAFYTVGYEGWMVDALLDRLLRVGIKRLIDVRRNPIARRYGFHRVTLCRLCKDVGIDYAHFPSLGVPSAWRSDLSDDSSYERLFERYMNEIVPRQLTVIDEISRMVKEMPSALMCMEAQHDRCHRSRLSQVVSRQSSLPVTELRTG
jgi:uncharacterized protein (DUF488 family)